MLQVLEPLVAGAGLYASSNSHRFVNGDDFDWLSPLVTIPARFAPTTLTFFGFSILRRSSHCVVVLVAAFFHDTDCIFSLDEISPTVALNGILDLIVRSSFSQVTRSLRRPKPRHG
jgi:hypothetical protein